MKRIDDIANGLGFAIRRASEEADVLTKWVVENDLKYKLAHTHISQIRIGDTIKCRDGVIRTICKSNIHYIHGIGTTIFGDSYNLGYIPVDKVVFFHVR